MKGGAREGEGRKKGSGQAADYRVMLEPYAEQLISNGFEVLLQAGGVPSRQLWISTSEPPI
jgi:hypothetical protein